MVRLTASAEGLGSSFEASRIILAPESIAKWFSSVKTVESDPTYPREGSHVRWTSGPHGRYVFDAVVVENRLPEELVQAVKTPSADSTVTHRFEDLPNDRFLYVKTVEPKMRGASRVFAPLLRWIIGSSMRGEVRRAVALVGVATPP